MESGVTMEVANEALKTSLSTPEEKLPKKRPGRPVAGGNDTTGTWKALTDKFLSGDASFKTKNGLPGIPYALKELIAMLKDVWSQYAGEACKLSTEDAPTDWEWCWANTGGLCTAILDDIHCENAAGMLTALNAVCKLHGKHAEAEEYASAEKATVTGPMEPSYSMKKYGVGVHDLFRIREYLRAKKKEDANTPDAVRIMGWGDVLFSILLGDAGVRPGLEHVDPSFINDLCVWISTSLPELAATTSCLITPDAVMYVFSADTGHHTEVRLTNAEAKAAVAWAFAQRQGAKTGDRFLPRRLSVETILSRLTRGPLAPALHGRQLKLQLIHTVLMTHMYRDVMAALQNMPVRADIHLQNLATAVFPELLEACLPALVFPPLGAVKPDDLVKDEAPGAQAGAGSSMTTSAGK